MRKILVLFGFLISMNVLGTLFVYSKIMTNEQALIRLNPDINPAFNPILRRLGTEELTRINNQLSTEVRLLQHWKSWLLATAIFLLVCCFTVFYRFSFSRARFDGFFLFLSVCLIWSIPMGIKALSAQFEMGHNADLSMNLWTMISLVLIQPVGFYLAYRWNEAEIAAGLHSQIWISKLTIGITVLSGIIILAMGIMWLMTPDLSGNMT